LPGNRTISTDVRVTANITAARVESLPVGTDLTSLLKAAPATATTSPLDVLATDGINPLLSQFVIDGADVAAVQAGGVNSAYARLPGRTAVMVEPEYSKEAGEAGVLGEVEVVIKVNRAGAVVMATAVSGDISLRVAAESAAKLSRFAPTIVNGRSFRVNGTIAYKFVAADNIEVFVRRMKAEKPNDAEIRAEGVAGKLHFWVFAVVERLAAGDTVPSANETNFVRDGKANIQLELTVDPATVAEKLKEQGFEMVASRGRTTVTGRIAPDKIVGLAEVEEVKLILPKL
jgi:hypothetical protein